MKPRGAIRADWNTAEVLRRVAAGRQQLLPRAVGLHKRRDLCVLDATAGLGRDGYTMAALGAYVTMAERNATVVGLLRDAHRSAPADVAGRIEVVHADARDLLARGWDVIYLDPMYPDLNKTALAKKDLQFLRELIGVDTDADALLLPARRHARLRVVVKRPLKAPPLAGLKPHHCLSGSQARFDVYLPSTPPAGVS